MTLSNNSIPVLVILGPAGKDSKGRKRVKCQCECGTIFIAGDYEVNRTTRSCGCYQRRRVREACMTHGRTGTTEWKIWTNIKERCLNPKNSGYHKYGGRGIVICAAWKESFMEFFSDMGKRPGAGYSIERRNNDGPYSPDNCYWATYSQQARNRRSSVYVAIQGESMLLIEACEKYGVPYSKAHLRLSRGWSTDHTFEVKVLNGEEIQ